MIAGTALGILIGLISGTVFLLLLKTADEVSANDLGSIFKIITQLFAIAGFVGGGWYTGTLFKAVNPEQIANAYFLSLTVTFVLIAAYPGTRWVLRLGEDLGKGAR